MQKKYLEAGEIVSTHGVQGEVKILPWTDGPEFLLQFDTFYLDGRPYAVRSARVHKTCVLASLEGIDTPEQGMALRGQARLHRPGRGKAAGGQRFHCRSHWMSRAGRGRRRTWPH